MVIHLQQRNSLDWVSGILTAALPSFASCSAQKAGECPAGQPVIIPVDFQLTAVISCSVCPNQSLAALRKLQLHSVALQAFCHSGW